MLAQCALTYSRTASVTLDQLWIMVIRDTTADQHDGEGIVCWRVTKVTLAPTTTKVVGASECEHIYLRS